ncbi:MAG: hypothetical protein VYD19_02140, partial [Myxococcota bacterium]|nr:hypothetical protein [Myxococcota bacterium]
MSRSSPLYLLQTWLRLLALLALVACADPGAGPLNESGDSGVDMLSPPSGAGDCIEEFIDEEGNCTYDDSLYDREDLENADDDDLLNVVDNDDIMEQESTFLTQEGDGKFTIYTNETTRIGVRAISRVGAPAEDVQVRFELLEDEESQPFGSVLSANQSFT